MGSEMCIRDRHQPETQVWWLANRIGVQVLGRRLASAAVLITTMIALLYFDYWLGEAAGFQRPGFLLAILATVIATAAADGFWRLWKAGNVHPSWLMMSGAALMMGLCNFPLLYTDYPLDCPIGKLGWVLFGIAGAVLTVFAYEMFRFDGSDDSPRAMRRSRNESGAARWRLCTSQCCSGSCCRIDRSRATTCWAWLPSC